jgi:hypothetical protein
MGNCFISKPSKPHPKYEQTPTPDQAVLIPARREEKEDTDSPTKAINLFKQKQKVKEDTITERAEEAHSPEEKKNTLLLE